MGGLDHDGVMARVCGVCYRKQKSLQNITESTLHLIQKHHWSLYSLTSGDYPRVICSGCRSILMDHDDVKMMSPRKLTPPKYETMRGTRASRGSSKCPCGWCDIWRMNGLQFKEYMAGASAPLGRPSETPPAPLPESRQVCDACHGEMA